MMTEKKLSTTSTTSEAAGLSFYMPVEIYFEDNLSPDKKYAPFINTNLPAQQLPNIDALVLPSGNQPGLYVWDTTSYTYCVPYTVINQFLTSGGYCKIYRGLRTQPITPTDPEGADYAIYESGKLQQGTTTVPASATPYVAIYNGVPFLLNPATPNTLGGVMVPGGALEVDNTGRLSVHDASATQKGVVTYVTSKTDIATGSNTTLAVDNKTLAEKLTDYAPLNSPVLTGTPKSVTPGPNPDNQMIATVGYVTDQLRNLGTGVRTSHQYWHAVTSQKAGDSVQPAASMTINSGAFNKNNRLDFSFIINDGNTENNKTPNTDGSNPLSTGHRGVRVVLSGDGVTGGDIILIGASVTDDKHSLSQQYIGATGTTETTYTESQDPLKYQQTYIDKKVDGNIWQNGAGDTYFMVTMTQLGEYSAAVTTSYPVKIDSNDIDWGKDIDIKIECLFSADKDATFIASASVSVYTD